MGRRSNSQYRAAARRDHHKDGECEVDENALISKGEDGGAYVQAWVWVDDSDCDENTLGED
jgi:hypothetical protein